MDIYEQNAAYEESLRQDMDREFQEQLKKIEELTMQEEIERMEKEKKTLEEIDKKPTKEELRILRMKFYIGNNNGKNTK
jgi:hypothetical protein